MKLSTSFLSCTLPESVPAVPLKPVATGKIVVRILVSAGLGVTPLPSTRVCAAVIWLGKVVALGGSAGLFPGT